MNTKKCALCTRLIEEKYIRCYTCNLTAPRPAAYRPDPRNKFFRIPIKTVLRDTQPRCIDSDSD